MKENQTKHPASDAGKRENHPADSVRPAVESEVETTKNPRQKEEIADELFPMLPREQKMKRTHRVGH